MLIEGETGTGKDLVARYLHYGQGECTEPFIALNCAALTPSLFESELFGYEGGAFTGSQPRGRKGKLDMAQGGTLFLDEISEMPVNLQAKLLRVIQEKAFYRVGGLKKVPLDVRFICATNQDITAMVEKGTFRQDLYYRLNVARIQLPPLRERREEIIPWLICFWANSSNQKPDRYQLSAQKPEKSCRTMNGLVMSENCVML